jgi:hypothetical protein
LYKKRDASLSTADLNFFSVAKKNFYIPSLNQIDLVPTLSVLMGLPIPFANLGAVAIDLFPRAFSSRHAIEAIKINAYQVQKYIREGVGEETSGFKEMKKYWSALQKIESDQSSSEQDKILAYYDWLSAILEHCKTQWATFDKRLMNGGLFMTFAAAVDSMLSSGDILTPLLSIIHALLMTTTSFIVFEDDILRFALSSIILVYNGKSRWDALMALLVVRMTHYVGGCREEQFPHCQTWNHRNLSPPAFIVIFTAISLFMAHRFRSKSMQRRVQLVILMSWWLGWWLVDTSFLEESMFTKTMAAWTPRLLWLITLSSPSPSSIIMSLCVLQRPINGLVFLLASSLFYPATKRHRKRELLLALFGQLLFYVTGHQTTLSSLQWEASFIGFPWLVPPVQATLTILNTLIGPISAMMELSRTKDPDNNKRSKAIVMSHSTTVAVGCALACKQLCRHLMIWKIFAPRFLFSVLFLLCQQLILLVYFK